MCAEIALCSHYNWKKIYQYHTLQILTTQNSLKLLNNCRLCNAEVVLCCLCHLETMEEEGMRGVTRVSNGQPLYVQLCSPTHTHNCMALGMNLGERGKEERVSFSIHYKGSRQKKKKDGFISTAKRCS